MAGGIFISYRRDDSRHAAGRLFDRLGGAFERNQLFMDVDAIEPGADFLRALGEALDHCVVLLALIGPNWLEAKDRTGGRKLDNPSDLVRREIEYALRQGIRVIPVLLDGASLPDEGSLPASLKPLAYRQAMSIRHDRFGADADGLARSLAKMVEPRRWHRAAAEALQAPPPAFQPFQPRRGTRRAKAGWTLYWIVFGLAALASLPALVSSLPANVPTGLVLTVLAIAGLGFHLERSGKFVHRWAAWAYGICAVLAYFVTLSEVNRLLGGAFPFWGVATALLVLAAVAGVYVSRVGGLASRRPELVGIAWAYALLVLPAQTMVVGVLEVVLPWIGMLVLVPAGALVAALGVYLRRWRGAASGRWERVLYWVGITFPVAVTPAALCDFYKWSYLGPGAHGASGWLLSAIIFAAGAWLMLVDLRRHEAIPGAENAGEVTPRAAQ
jgi:TIR domain